MKIILIISLSFLITNLSNAHPGIGIVKDSKGNIYYTDLKHVWKVSTNGKKSIAVSNVHTHELYMDANDDLFGEHLWYNGERLNTWGHYVWSLRHSGKLDTIIKPTAGFLKNYSFVRDSIGNMYWAEPGNISSIKKRTPSGTVTTLSNTAFKDIRWMHVTKAGDVYFMDQQDMYKIDQSGNCRTVAKDLSKNTVAFGVMAGRHSMFGIWSDDDGNIYTANYSGQVVKKITPSGKVENAAHSLSPWSPTGGLFDDEGNLWLLEASMANEVRVRKITKNTLFKSAKSNAVMHNNILPLTITVAMFTGMVLYFMKLAKERKHVV